ncbi:hypothetical protein EDB19DRAFT_1915934 [Suillus lakei]|nr:hypothetical protein EDB19DRAFT_1915934 [Suillus lakei]
MTVVGACANAERAHSSLVRVLPDWVRPQPQQAQVSTATSPLSSPSQYSDTAPSPEEGYPSQGFQTDWHNPRPLTSPAPSCLGLATQQEVDVEGFGIVQHQDVGQSSSQEEGGELKDVPPAYESIRQ